MLYCTLLPAITFLTISDLPPVGTVAPRFRLPDAHTGKARSLPAKRPIALFFFCGCSACHQVATAWATQQRANALPPNTATVIVYQSSDPNEARSFARDTGLDTKQTAVLLDPDLCVTEKQYHALPCPRLFVLDAHGTIRFENTGNESISEPAPVLVARCIAALQATGTTDRKTP